MKNNSITEKQIAVILQEAEKGDQTVADICRQYKVSTNSFYRWRLRFGNVTAHEATRLRELENENGRLKRILAERDLEIDILKEHHQGTSS